jgi:hypothetical protein
VPNWYFPIIYHLVHITNYQDVKNLISKIIVAKPALRATLNQIKEHCWTTQSIQNSSIQSYYKQPAITASVMKRLINFGLLEDDILEYKETKKPGPIKAALYMLDCDSSDLSQDIESNLDSIKPGFQQHNLKFYNMDKPIQINNLLSKIKKKNLNKSHDEKAEKAYDSFPPVCSVFQIKENLGFRDYLSRRLKELDVLTNQSLEKADCEWIPGPHILDLQLDAEETDLLDALNDHLECESERSINFRIQIMDNEVKFSLVKGFN